MTKTLASPVQRGPGRPRAFDMDVALDGAVRIFSERGFNATSIGELAEAMGLAEGSIYKAFKDKKAVFLAAFDRYREVREDRLRKSLAETGTARDRLRQVLRFYAESSLGEEGRRGCLVVSSASEVATVDADVAERVAQAFKGNEMRLVGLIREGQDDGSISAQVDAPAVGHAMFCLLQGLRLVRKVRPSRTGVETVIATALKMID